MRRAITLLMLVLFLDGNAQQVRHYTIYFNLNKHSLTPAATNQLLAITTTVSDSIKEITITGHADKFGKESHNKTLSQKRAVAVGQAFSNMLQARPAINLLYYGKDSLLTQKYTEQQLNRRVEIAITYIKPATVTNTVIANNEAVTVLQPFNQDVALQQYNVNLDDTVVIRGTGGTRIKITPGSIQTNAGKPAAGQATLLIKEYYQPADIILAGLNTMSGDRLLQTGGMAWFKIVKDGDTMSAVTKKPVEIRMPVVNNELNNMGVFAMHSQLDSAGWSDIKKSFLRIYNYWDWPQIKPNLYGLTLHDYRFENWIIKGKTEDEYRVPTPAVYVWGIGLGNASNVKKIKRKIEKIDSVTLAVQAHITYRNRGIRLFNRNELDTTFQVRLMKAEYTATVSRLNWINCDRFYYTKNPTNLYVKTANTKGASVVLYFKNLHAYMPAYSYKDQYEIRNIPPGEKVSIIAFGKEGSNFFYSKTDHVVGNNETKTIQLQQLSSKEFNDKIKSL